MLGYVYILRSDKSGRLYLGTTCNPERRFAQHNSNAVGATRGKGPWQMIKLLAFPDETTARRAETYIKSQKSKLAFQALIEGRFPWPTDLQPQISPAVELPEKLGVAVASNPRAGSILYGRLSQSMATRSHTRLRSEWRTML